MQTIKIHHKFNGIHPTYREYARPVDKILITMKINASTKDINNNNNTNNSQQSKSVSYLLLLLFEIRSNRLIFHVYYIYSS